MLVLLLLLVSSLRYPPWGRLLQLGNKAGHIGAPKLSEVLICEVTDTYKGNTLWA